MGTERIKRHYTLGAVAPDLHSLDALDERLENAGVDPFSLLVLSRRKDESLIKVSLPEAEVRVAEATLRRIQWFEFGSAYLGVTAVSVLMGAVHLPTGLVVQTVMTLAAIIGLVIFHRRPQIKRKVVGLGLPDELAEKWEAGFSSGFALALITVPEDLFDGAQEAFLEDESLIEPLAVDRRVVL
jgi:hypothetical protein